MRVYFDVCCLNRPFDDQRQERIRLESEAVILLMQRAVDGQIVWVSSEVVDHEIAAARDGARRERVAALAGQSSVQLVLGAADVRRAEALQKLGFHAFDALHVACAERGAVEVFLTTDDRLQRVARRHRAKLGTVVRNPVDFVLELNQP